MSKDIETILSTVEAGLTAAIEEANRQLRAIGNSDVLSFKIDYENVTIYNCDSIIGETIVAGNAPSILKRALKPIKTHVHAAEMALPIPAAPATPESAPEVPEVSTPTVSPAPTVPQPAVKSQKKDWITSLMDKLGELMVHANKRLEEVICGAFTMSEVEFSASYDDVTISVRSGNLPIFVALRTDKFESILKNARASVWKMVDAIKSKAGESSAMRSEEEALAKVSESDVCASAAAAMVAAAKDVVDKVNASLCSYADTAALLYGSANGADLAIKGYNGGFVIVGAGGRTCWVSTFPKVWNARTVTESIEWIDAKVSALGDSLRRHLASAAEKIAIGQELRDIAAERAQLDSRVASVKERIRRSA